MDPSHHASPQHSWSARHLVLILAIRNPQRGFEPSLIAAGIVLFRLSAALSILNWIPESVYAAGFRISTQEAFQAVLMFAMTWVLIRRLWHTWRERQELNLEFEAAHEMQESLVQRMPDTPGFAVQSAYRPASQVGGDFYRIFPADGGSILVIVGDVSGKGLRAAMTVSGLVCAMEAIETRMPGLFLTKLNVAAKAYMQSGFATCCAALVQRSGEVVIANAGHLAPYVDGHEVEIEAGLPLGIAPGVEYAESTTRGERFTFVSDGVVEAANAQGELFGFDRTREIAGESAQEIAGAAKAWGQNDDITVVTIQRIASSDVRRSA